MVMPCVRRRLTVSNMTFCSFSVSVAEGSSMISRRQLRLIALQISTICFCATERLDTISSTFSESPSCVSSLSASTRMRFQSIRPFLYSHLPRNTFSATESVSESLIS